MPEWPAARAWFLRFSENAFVSRVKQRMCIRIVRCRRPAYNVLMCLGSCSPAISGLRLVFLETALSNSVWLKLSETASVGAVTALKVLKRFSV
jgi:hypothetical protein